MSSFFQQPSDGNGPATTPAPRTTSRPVVDVTTDDEEEALHTPAAATPASVLAPASPNKPGRLGKGKEKGKSSPSPLENRDISRDPDQHDVQGALRESLMEGEGGVSDGDIRDDDDNGVYHACDDDDDEDEEEEIPDNIDGGLGRSGQSVEPAPLRKKQKRADKAGGGGGGGGGDGLDDFDNDDIRRATQASLEDGGGGSGGSSGGSGSGSGSSGGSGSSSSGSSRTPLPPHQDELLKEVQASADHHSFDDSGRKKLAEVAEDYSKDKRMSTGTSTADVLRAACAEYSEVRLHALRTIRRRRLTPAELRDGGMEVFDPKKDYGGAVNYFVVYVFSYKEAALAMVNKWQYEMVVVRAQLCGAVRLKIDGHDWTTGPLRLFVSGDGLKQSVAKYEKGLAKPPSSADRARRPSKKGGSCSFWIVPAGLVLVGGDALTKVTVETYVWRQGDPSRGSREVHEMIAPLGVWGGLVFRPGSSTLNQQVGGTFNDAQRRAGGKADYAEGAALAGGGKSQGHSEAQGAERCGDRGRQPYGPRPQRAGRRGVEGARRQDGAAQVSCGVQCHDPWKGGHAASVYSSV